MFDGGRGSFVARAVSLAGLNKMDKVLRAMKAKMIRLFFGFFILRIAETNSTYKFTKLWLRRWRRLATGTIAGRDDPALAVRRNEHTRSVTHLDYL